MDTIIVRLNRSEKTQLLLELLQSLDFVDRVEYFDRYVEAKELLDAINRIAADSPLARMTADEVNEEISQYRRHGS